MAIKKALFNIKGMTRDLAASKFSPEYAYENKNLRLIATDNNTTFALENEKGNAAKAISWDRMSEALPPVTEGNYVMGTPIGQQVLGENLILFTAGEEVPTVSITAGEVSDVDITPVSTSAFSIPTEYEDNIYKFWFSGNTLKGRKLFEGDLNFDKQHPIESIGLYENEELQKVYWTDGINPPRVVNISATAAKINMWAKDSFNFVADQQLKETVKIERNLVASGSFAPGVLQYCFTYYNLYGHETNIFYTSPLYYVSYNNRGASPEDVVSNSFTIQLSLPDTRFEYVRIYSILRTTKDAVPQVRKVVDLTVPKVTYTPWVASTSYAVGNRVMYEGKAYKCKTANSDSYFQYSKWDQEFIISYTDDGEEGQTVDATTLFYLGGENVIVGTMSQKDNTLFLGDIKYDKLIIPASLQTALRSFTPSFTNISTLNILGNFGGFYNYTSQLPYNSGVIKGFKYQEYYRFGVQFQYKTGKWSSPVWIADVKNTSGVPSSKIFDTYEDSFPFIYKPIAQSYISNTNNIFGQLVALGYVNIRPVVVYPSITDRESVCQGILCPTVYNAEDRYGNSPFAQASWFARAFAPCDLSRENDSQEWMGYDNFLTPSIDSKCGAIRLKDTSVTLNPGTASEQVYYMDIINRGSWPEFRHNTCLPASDKRNCEIQCNEHTYNPLIHRNNSSTNPYSQYWKSRNKETFYVDQSILTFHSPDIEFDKEVRSLDSSNLKLRIVGTVPLTAFDSNIDIQSSTPPMSKDDGSVWMGFYSEPVNSENAKTQGWRNLISAPMWLDGCSNLKYKPRNGEYGWLYVVYPWQRSGSLNNTKSADTSGNKPAKLSQKKLANTKFSYNSLYLDNNDIWYAWQSGSATKTGITGVQIFDSEEITPIKLPAQDTGLPEIVYYGNIDKVITYPTTSPKDSGYPIMTSYYGTANTFSMHNMFLSDYEIISKGYVNNKTVDDVTTDDRSHDPVSMKYKSTPHAVLALKNTTSHYQRVLPTFTDIDINGNLTANSAAETFDGSKHLFWDTNNIIAGVSQDIVSIPSDGGLHAQYSYAARFGFFWLAELYNDSITTANRFGGQTQEAFENNQWMVAGDAIPLKNDTGELKSSITLQWTEGDTYYQRYDCLKTYPFTHEDQNSVTEIVSFMCETRVNIDGRYDRNRGQSNNLYVSPQNFNLLNPVYSQNNNFFNYRATNLDKLLLNKFPNTVTWTKTKTLGEEVDTWTNITLASTLDLDGDKGTVRALRRFNDSLIAFQDNGISQILYNENVQIAATTGIPIEIANSGKVSGKRYISNHVGCTNKWSICSTTSGIYFIDDRTKDIYRFTGELDNLSDRLGFHSWMVQNFNGINVWNPSDFNSGVTYYDRVNQDILFITKDTCLAFNENLGNFSSFYSYEHTPYFENIGDRGIAWQKAENEEHYQPWMHREGNYNMFFNKYQPYWTTVVVNPDATEDKVFNNVEFRADSFNSDTLVSTHTFDHLKTWNEYQEGQVDLTNTPDRPSPLKKKFRVWRANIPRWNVNKNGQTANKRDRMRNPWLYLKLSTEDENTYKTVLHDLVVDYFE